MSKELLERLEKVKEKLKEAQRYSEENKLYIQDLKDTITSIERALKPMKLGSWK